jgi:hypothetical protein
MRNDAEKRTVEESIDRQKAAIVRTLSKGDRVELIPVKDGVKVVRIKREEMRAE